MPKQNQPITHRPKVADESTGTGTERHGKHREQDEALPGTGDEKGGLSRYAGESSPVALRRRTTPGRARRRQFEIANARDYGLNGGKSGFKTG